MTFNIPEFTVTEFSRSIKRVVEDAFGYVKIKGEITGFKKASSGHIYFSLKHEESTLSAVCFKNMANLIDFEIADGLQIIAFGQITTFQGRSNYQIIVEKIEISGIGAILEMIEKRRQKLCSEGLFDEIHKKPLPFFPKIIGVITSETGAVIQDIKHRIEDRCPTHIKLYPTLVQSDKAASEIIKAIKFFNKLKISEKPEVIIIARGGGSFEDLLPFNDEDLVRTVFASDIPIISAVGHETDTTLIDYVADLRAPTPTAAAEIATPVLSDLKNTISYLEKKLFSVPQAFLSQKIQHIKNLQKYIIEPRKLLEKVVDRFSFSKQKLDKSVQDILNQKIQNLNKSKISINEILYFFRLSQQKINYLESTYKSSFFNFVANKESYTMAINKLLKSYHYKEVLKRGFAITKNKNGDILSSITQIKKGQNITVELQDGEFESYVLLEKNDIFISSARGSKKSNIKKDEKNIQPQLI